VPEADRDTHSKKLVWFEQSADEAVEGPDKFNAAMAQLVRSLVM